LPTTAKAAATPYISIESKPVNFWENIPWARVVSWVRVVLAAVTLVVTLFYLSTPVLTQAVLVLFLGYSIVLAVRGKGQTGLLGLLALFGDTVYLLVMASYGGANLLWLASLFYLYVLIEALVYHTAAQLGVVTGVSAVFCALLPNAVRQLEPTVVVAGAVAVMFAVSRQRQTAKIDGLNDKVKEAQKAAEKASEVERQRIASDFHDGPLQSFISLQMRLEILRKLLERDARAGMEDLHQLQALAQSQIRDLRAFLHSMRPVDVDGANLVATARRAAESFQKETGIPVTFLGAGTPVGLPPEMTSDVLQMLREALHNVQKHSAATRVAVALEKTDRGLEISVDDNGHGFNFAGTYSLEELELLRLGPASLKRRARSLNADLILESRPGRGAGLKFRIPLQ
jgi:signal transduction histidine kinase